MKYDYFAFLKNERFEIRTYNKFKNDNRLYFFHSKRDKLFNENPNNNGALYFSHGKKFYGFKSIGSLLSKNEFAGIYLRLFHFKLSFLYPFFTASENKFYSIQNPIAKEKPTGLPILRGNSLKGALRQASVEVLEKELLSKNYGDKFQKYSCKDNDEVLNIELSGDEDRFFFKRRTQLVKLFGNEKDAIWFTFRSLIATGGIKDVEKTKDTLQKITNAFEKYLKSKKIVNSEGARKGRLLFEDLHFKKVTLDVITPLRRKERTPTSGPIFYEVVPENEIVEGKILWFPFDLISEGKTQGEIETKWKEDEEILKRAFDLLKDRGIGAKTKNGWGRFDWEEI